VTIEEKQHLVTEKYFVRLLIFIMPPAMRPTQHDGIMRQATNSSTLDSTNDQIQSENNRKKIHLHKHSTGCCKADHHTLFTPDSSGQLGPAKAGH
jgi:hypothetical protein